MKAALGHPIAPFFRFPALRHPPEMVKYLGERNVAIFSTDMDSFDFKVRKPDQVIKSVMTKLKTHGKGIVLIRNSPWMRGAPHNVFSLLILRIRSRSS